MPGCVARVLLVPAIAPGGTGGIENSTINGFAVGV